MAEKKSYYHIKKSLQEFKKVLGVNNIPSDNENGGYKEIDNGAGSGCQASHTSLADTSGDNSVHIDSENNECDSDSISLALDNEDVTPALVQSPTVSEDTLGPSSSDESVVLELDANKSNVNKPPIHQKLIDWYNKNNISLAAMKELLDIIKPDYPSLPTDPRTLLKTENNLGLIRKITNGEFVYYGIEKMLNNAINFDTASLEIIKLDINIDGVQVFKSRNTSFWPILVSCHNSIKYLYNSANPFVVAIFYGNKKPGISEFLSEFCNELKHLMENGFIHNERLLKVELRAVIADAPAKAFLKQIKTHGGYFACDRCEVKGDYRFHAVSYENVQAPRRTDDSFRMKRQSEHHIGTSPFISLEVDMINDFVIDYMHLVLLGIVRRIISTFFSKAPYKLSSAQKSLLEERLINVKKFFPCDFNRKPRSFVELDRFKASEFRHIIMYTGIILFKDIVQEKVYENFLVLMFIIRILLDGNLSCDQEMLEYARNLCFLFVKQYRKIYKTMNVTYNIHSLIHIVDDVERLGVLDSFSAFPYENFLGNIKRKIRSSNNPLSQINRRLSEGYSFSHKHFENSDRTFVINGHRIIPTKMKDSCILLHNESVASVEEIHEDNLRVCKYKIIKPATKYPTDSSIIGVNIVCKTNEKVLIPKSSVKNKCAIFPYKGNKYLSLPMT